MRRIFITGATGFVGAHVARMLVERGDQVTALVRPSSDRRLLENLPIRCAVGDLTDLDSIRPHLAGIDELYHVAADYRLWSRDPGEIYASNVGGTRNVLEAAAEAGVGKVIYTSTVGCIGLPRDGAPGCENTPVSREHLIGHYKRSKFDAERVALDYASTGLPVVIVNPSTPVGPGDIKPTPTGKIVLDFLKGKMAAYVDTGLNLIAVEDAASGHLLAAERGRIGERYILGNRNMTLREILVALAEITGRRAPGVRIPHWVAIGAASANTLANRMLGREPSIPIEGALMARERMFFSSEKSVRELGLPQSPIKDALERSVRWFTDRGYV